MPHDRKYFPKAAGEAALRARYKTLAKELHPDKSGLSGDEFSEMRKEYEEAARTGVSEQETTRPTTRLSAETALNIMDFCCAASERWPLMRGLSSVAQQILRTQVRENTIVINPNLEDLLIPNVVQIDRDGETFVVPAWHRCLVYDSDVIVLSEPDLPPGVSLDQAGNLNVSLYTATEDVLSGFLSDGETVATGTSLVLRNKGVPVGNTADIFDVSNRMHILIHA